MNYRLIQKHNPAKPADPKKWYATRTVNPVIELKDLVKDISDGRTISQIEVEAVLIGLIKFIPRYLLNGNVVQLREFGSFRISLSGEGVEDPEDYHVGMIHKKKIVFNPGTGLKKQVVDLTFNKIK